MIGSCIANVDGAVPFSRLRDRNDNLRVIADALGVCIVPHDAG
jgi:hypothetical protein